MTRVFDIAFEGGGARAVAHLGAIRAIEERGITIGRVVGTSSGAIGASMVAAGFDTHQFEEMLFAKSARDGRSAFAQFLVRDADLDADQVAQSGLYKILKSVDVPFLPNELEARIDRQLAERILELPGVFDLFSLLELGGVYASEPAVVEMRGWLSRSPYGDLSRATLADLYRVSGAHFTAIAANVTSGRLLALNHVTAPDVPIVEAVRMSTCIPFVYQEVRWRKEWGRYLGYDLSDCVVVDGGALSNFPLGLLATHTPVTEMLMGPPPEGERDVVGLLIDTDLQLDGTRREVERWHADGTRNEQADDMVRGSMPFARRVGRLVETMMSAHDRMFMDRYADAIVRLPAAGYGVTDFEMSVARREALAAACHRVTSAWLDAKLDLGTSSHSPASS